MQIQFCVLILLFSISAQAQSTEGTPTPTPSPTPLAKISPISKTEYKVSIGLSTGSRSETLALGQTETKSLIQLPTLKASGAYHLSERGNTERRRHFVIEGTGQIGVLRTSGGLNFSSDWQLSADLTWLYLYAVGPKNSISAFSGLEYEKTNQASLHQSASGYAGPLFARSNKILWFKLGPKFRTSYFHSWQHFSMAYLHSLKASSDFSGSTPALSTSLSGYDLNLKFGVYRRSFFETNYRHFSGSNEIALADSRWSFGLGWSFY